MRISDSLQAFASEYNPTFPKAQQAAMDSHLSHQAVRIPVFGSDASGWDCRTVATPDAGQPYRIIFAFARARSVFMRIEDGQNVYGTLSGDEIAKTMIEEI